MSCSFQSAVEVHLMVDVGTYVADDSFTEERVVGESMVKIRYKSWTQCVVDSNLAGIITIKNWRYHCGIK